MVIVLPRVPDERVGVCNRVGLLSRGLGALVNRYKHCQMWAGGCARCGGGKLYILGVAGFITPIWDVLVPEGEQEEAGEHICGPKLIKKFPN